MKLILIALFSLATLGLGVTSASALRIGGVGVGNGPGGFSNTAGCTGVSYHGCSCQCAGSGGTQLRNCETGFTDDGMCQFCMGDACGGSIGRWGARAMFP